MRKMKKFQEKRDINHLLIMSDICKYSESSQKWEIEIIFIDYRRASASRERKEFDRREKLSREWKTNIKIGRNNNGQLVEQNI